MSTCVFEKLTKEGQQKKGIYERRKADLEEEMKSTEKLHGENSKVSRGKMFLRNPNDFSKNCFFDYFRISVHQVFRPTFEPFPFPSPVLRFKLTSKSNCVLASPIFIGKKLSRYLRSTLIACRKAAALQYYFLIFPSYYVSNSVVCFVEFGNHVAFFCLKCVPINLKHHFFTS